MTWLFAQPENRPFHDRTWQRHEMAAWDERWCGLSPAAREAFARLPIASRETDEKPSTPLADLPGAARGQLTAAGLIEPAGAAAVRVPTRAWGFAARLRTLRRCRLLDSPAESLRQYVRQVYQMYQLGTAFDRVVEAALGPCPGQFIEDFFTHFVPRRFWPDWVAAYLADPVAGPLLARIAEAGGRLPLESLAGRLPRQPAARVRQALDGLVNHLALVEDVDPETGGLLVGFRPEVWADRQRSDRPEPLPRLTPQPAPEEVAPDGGLRVLDLRAVLLELAGTRTQLRQDGSLYAREQERFLATLQEAPAWLADESTRRHVRLPVAVAWAQGLGFARLDGSGGKALFLELAPPGSAWLAAEVGAQHDHLYRSRREANPDFDEGTDFDFLGSHLTATTKQPRPGARAHSHRAFDADARRAFREAVYRALDRLPMGTFVRQRDFVEFIARGPDNPLLLGRRKPADVEVVHHGRVVPPLIDLYEDRCRELLGEVVGWLLLMGAVQAGPAPEGGLLVGRLPWLDVYFGKAAPPPPAPRATRTVVQPDFSVIIIGPDAAAAADLALFSDRVQGTVGQGALTFKISRESVLRAAGMGLGEGDVLARLTNHASAPPPANVVTQIRSWCGQVRRVTSLPGRLFRCPDLGTAERVRSLLGKGAERVGETMVFWSDTGRVRPALRQKLRDVGVLVEEGEQGPPKVKRRGAS